MMISYKCNLCNNRIKKIYKTPTHPGFLTCVCSGVMEKELPDISTSSVEVFDNGSMTKRVELRKDSAQRMKERGDKLVEILEERETVIKKHDSQD